jgi:hypothetical protein
MDTATENNENGKRARANAQRASSQRSSAIEEARFAASILLASLPATIKPLAESLLDKFLKLRIELLSHEKTKSRLAKEDFRPISTRFKFDLNTTTRVKEQANAEYEALSDSCQVDIAVCKNQLKVSICKLVDLEIKVIKSAIATHFCEAVGTLAIACAISSHTIEDHLADDLVFFTFDEHHETLLRYSEILEAQEFYTKFKTATLHPSAPHEHGTLSAARARGVRHISESFKPLIETLFVRTWKAYLAVKDQDARDIHLQAFVENRMKTTATEPVAMELDTITADSPALENLIDSRISAKEKRIDKMISRLTNQVNSATQKNLSKGASSSAHQKKKTGKPKGKSNAPKADAAAKGTNKDQPKNGRNKQTPKRSNSKKSVTWRR